MAAPAKGTVVVRGLRDLNRTLKHAEKNVRREVRAAEREIAAPVKSAAERYAVDNISHIDTRSAWWKMRIGVTQKLIYVAPLRRGKKTGTQKRPKFDDTLWDKALKPAQADHQADFEARVEDALDTVATIFNRTT